jgi:hypothetical protein
MIEQHLIHEELNDSAKLWPHDPGFLFLRCSQNVSFKPTSHLVDQPFEDEACLNVI